MRQSGDSYLSHSDARLHFGLGCERKLIQLKCGGRMGRFSGSVRFPRTRSSRLLRVRPRCRSFALRPSNSPIHEFTNSPFAELIERRSRQSPNLRPVFARPHALRRSRCRRRIRRRRAPSSTASFRERSAIRSVRLRARHRMPRERPARADRSRARVHLALTVSSGNSAGCAEPASANWRSTRVNSRTGSGESSFSSISGRSPIARTPPAVRHPRG